MGKILRIFWLSLIFVTAISSGTGVFATDASELPPLPPGYDWPGFEDPATLIEPGRYVGEQRPLQIVGRDRVVHQIDLDPTPLGWAYGMLDLVIGLGEPWRPLFQFGLFWDESGAGVTALIRGGAWRFDELPYVNDAGQVTVAMSSSPAGGLLEVDEKGVVVTANGCRYLFVPGATDGAWRVASVESVTRPGKQAQVVYRDDGRPAEIVFPNKQKAVFVYRAGPNESEQVFGIQLPFDRIVTLERDDLGAVTSLALSIGTQAAQYPLQAYTYQRAADGSFVGFTDHTGLRRVIQFEREAPARPDQSAATSLVIRDARDLTYRFRRVYAKRLPGTGRMSLRVVDGFSEAGWSIERSVEANQAHDRPAQIRSIQPVRAGHVALNASRLSSGPQTADACYAVFETLDPDGQADQGLVTERWAVSVFGDKATVGLDALGRVAYVNDGGDSARLASYLHDAEGDLVEIRVGEDRYMLESDRWGRLYKIVFPNGNSRRFIFDQGGRGDLLVRIADLPKPKASDNLLDDEQLQAATPDAGKDGLLPEGTRLTDIRRDASGVITEIAYPDGRTSRFVYDRRGRLVQMMRSGVGVGRWAVRYDKINRVQQVQDAKGGREIYEYHPSGRIAKHTIDPPGRDRTVREYDLLGRMVTETTAALGRMRYAYDSLGRVTRIVHPDGTDTVQSFDHLNRVIAIRGSHQPAVDITYDGLGRPVAKPAADPAVIPKSHTPAGGDE